MQTYIVTWHFESSEDEVYASDAFIDFFESGKHNEQIEGYEKIVWLHSPHDGTGVVICKSLNYSNLYKIFNPWREKFGMVWEYKPAISTEALVSLLKDQKN